MNASSLMILSLALGDTPPPPVAANAPVVVSTGNGCVGCGTTAHGAVVYGHGNSPCYPCGGQHATLVDWVKAKSGPAAKPGLLSRFKKPAAKGHVVAASPCCDPCAGVGYHGGVVVPGTPGGTVGGTVVTPGTAGTPGGGAVIPKDMPKPKDPPKVDPKGPPTDLPKDLNKPKDPPKGPGTLNIPAIPNLPGSRVTGASGVNSRY